ncbi:MAG: radical SAM protein [Atopobiaceae bacterium]|nr:radical SAM protein [Atopobiaceae bacterium]
MRYILDKRFRLRGWDRLPNGVVDRERLDAHFVDALTMEALRLCDGSVDLDLPLVPAAIREVAGRLAELGVVHEARDGETLADGQRYRLHPNRYMKSVHWSVTGRCNCRCRHCYMSAPDAKYGEISHEDAMRIVSEMGECGVLSCSLTGGEALVRADFWDIVDGLLAQGIAITEVYSNGFLVNGRLLDELEGRGIRPQINMSFDGVGHHDWLRGIDGAEAAVRRAFEVCQERGFPTAAEMCLWRGNEGSLRESVNYLASVGCGGLKVNPVSDSGAWADGGYGADHGLSHEELFGVYLDYLEAFYEDLPKLTLHLGGFFLANGARPDEYRLPSVHVYGDPMRASLCVHARNTMYISAEGRALTCMGLCSMEDFQRGYPLVQEVGLGACLTDSKFMELVDTRAGDVLAHNERCDDCPWRALCLGGCRAGAMVDHPADVLAPDETACAYFRDGWVTRVQERVAELRPTAICVEREMLRRAGREDELPLRP